MPPLLIPPLDVEVSGSFEGSPFLLCLLFLRCLNPTPGLEQPSLLMQTYIFSLNVTFEFQTFISSCLLDTSFCMFNRHLKFSFLHMGLLKHLPPTRPSLVGSFLSPLYPQNDSTCHLFSRVTHTGVILNFSFSFYLPPIHQNALGAFFL